MDQDLFTVETQLGINLCTVTSTNGPTPIKNPLSPDLVIVNEYDVEHFYDLRLTPFYFS